MPKGFAKKKEAVAQEPDEKDMEIIRADRTALGCSPEPWIESRTDFVKRVSTDLLIEIMKQPGMSGKRDPAQHAFDRAEQLADLLGLKD